MFSSTLLRTLIPVAVLALGLSSVEAQTFCEPGIGGVILCPCGNNPSSLNRGCDNSLATGGAGMIGVANPSLSFDTFQITCAGIGTTGPSCSGSSTSNLSALYQGSATIPGGALFGDGVVCTTGTVILINVKPATLGGYRYPEFASDPSISSISAAMGDPLSVGLTRYYFVAYRDPCPTFCTPGIRNKSNSFATTWLP